MAEFLTTKGIASEIENIIRKAKEEIVLVSPYLQISDIFYERLEEASEANIPITILYGKDKLKNRERKSLNKLNTLRLYYFENLHAKCFYNEGKLIITSMNMYSFSEINNREMGVLFEKNKDRDLYTEAIKEVQSILKYSEKNHILKSDEKMTFEVTDVTENLEFGFCIRCERKINYNLDKPYCTDCFNSWQQFENVNYQESVCHNCGEYNSSTMMKPECWSCYSNN